MVNRILKSGLHTLNISVSMNVLSLLFLVLLNNGIASSVYAESEQVAEAPLLVDGKSTIFQRVLTRKEVSVFKAPSGTFARKINPFSPLYVYRHDGDWLKLGTTTTQAEFWGQAADMVEWKQNIIVSFTNSSNRQRQLLMKDKQALIDLMNDENVVQKNATLLAMADARTLDSDSDVNAVEPIEYVDIEEQFYIMPILDFERDMHPLSMNDSLILNVASLPLNDPSGQPERSGEFEVGIVFVFDTTKSMTPYIQGTREIMQDLVNQLEGSGVADKIHFGIVGFRDNVEAVPELEYRVKEILPLKKRESNQEVVDAIGEITVAQASSLGFSEDSLAGIGYALNDMNWGAEDTNIGGRYIILVTDAGPKSARDVNAASDISSEDMNILLRENSTAVLTLHLQTPSGAANHGYAKDQYAQLSRYVNNSFYFPIEGGSVSAFRTTENLLISSLIQQIESAKSVEMEQLNAVSPPEGITALGNAMRLAWLGRTQGTQAPDVINSWVSQLAVEDGASNAFTPRLLMTKNELATMAQLVDEFITLGESIQNAEDVENFHNQVREMIIRVAQNPSRIIDSRAEDVGDALEFLEDLPYQSQILRVSQERWMSNVMSRREILDGLDSKLDFYKFWLDSPARWIALYEGASDGDHVTAMPFEVLP